MNWKIHKSYRVSSILWKDKKLILLSSPCAVLILDIPYMPFPTVPRRNGIMKEEVYMHLYIWINHSYKKGRCS